jgi:hypothetical protein
MADETFVFEISQTLVSMVERTGDLKMSLWRRGGRDRHRNGRTSFLEKEEKRTHGFEPILFRKIERKKCFVRKKLTRMGECLFMR